MNSLKDNINIGEALLAENEKIYNRIKLNIEMYDDKTPKGILEESMLIMLNIQLINFRDRVNKINAKLTHLKSKYLIEFESDSLDANQNIVFTMEKAKKHIGRNPIAVSNRIEAIINEWEAMLKSESIDQEKKNDLYFELKSHIDFFKKKVK